MHRPTLAVPPSRSRLARTAATLGVVLAGLTAACSDAPSSPNVTADAPRPAQLVMSRSRGGSGETNKVGRVNPLSAPISVSFRIDPSQNGHFEIKAAGLEVDVPQGAVTTPVEITATALPGNVIAYEFQPHGLVFQKPLRVRQDLRAIDWRTASFGGLEIAYFADASALDAGSQVSVQEFLGSFFSLLSGRVEFDVNHFSGYMVSWGRS
jgi:hypothetical protein